MNHAPVKKSHGFTLIELMIVVAVVAILAALAIPGYQHAVRESRRAPAKTALLDLAGREERYHAINNIYSQDMSAALGYGVTVVAVPDTQPAYYQMTVIVPADGSTFQGTAAPLGDQVRDPCSSFSLTNFGVKTNAGNSLSSSDCWK